MPTRRFYSYQKEHLDRLEAALGNLKFKYKRGIQHIQTIWEGSSDEPYIEVANIHDALAIRLAMNYGAVLKRKRRGSHVTSGEWSRIGGWETF